MTEKAIIEIGESSKPKIVTDQDVFPIQPGDINTNAHFFGSFGKTEQEVSAKWVVKLAQRRGSWAPFTTEELKGFIMPFDFYGIDDEDSGLLVYQENHYHFTVEFITRCFLGSPAYQPSVQISTKHRNRNTDCRVSSKPAGLPPGDRHIE